MSYLAAVVRAVDFMEAHLTDDISLLEVAKAAHFSHWHFQRIFKEAIGETVGGYLRRRRLARAYDDLKQKKSRTIDIAFRYQFGSAEAFLRSFKEEFGITPFQSKKDSSPRPAFRKPPLDGLRIKYLMSDIEMEPEIRELSSFRIAGLPVSLPSPLAKESAYLPAVTKVWQDFVAQLPQAAGLDPGIKIGLILGMASPEHHVHDELLDYVAAAPAPAPTESLPVGFASYEVPAGRYAVFTAKGFHQQTQFIIDYVYSTWLPQSGRYRGEGPEFTWLDHRVSPLSPRDSAVEYFIPLRD